TWKSWFIRALPDCQSAILFFPAPQREPSAGTRALFAHLEAETAGSDDGLGAVANTERAQHRAHMDLDRAFGQIELPADELVRKTPQDQAEHIALPVGQPQAARVGGPAGACHGVAGALTRQREN